VALTQLFHKPFYRLLRQPSPFSGNWPFYGVGGIPMTHESNEVISLRNRFRALKAEMDLVHQAWQTAVREWDFDRQVSLMAHEGNLIRDTSAVMSAFHQLIAQELMRTHV
jgi:hypothetical protein